MSNRRIEISRNEKKRNISHCYVIAQSSLQNLRRSGRSSNQIVFFVYRINPVTGCFEHSKPNPLEGMTEEQKEFEALQLVDLVDKLTR